MRSSPKPSAGHGLSDSIHSTAECVKLSLVLGELRTFAVDHARRGVRDELLVGEHPLRTLDLLLYPRALCFDITVSVLGRAHDGFEDPLRVPRNVDAHAASPVDPRGG